MHPIIVIEGPDAVGKTTLARAYCKEFGARYIHLTLRKEMFTHQVASLTLAARWSKQTPVIIDRHWPSEQIYAGVYRGRSNLVYEAAWLERAMSNIGVFYIVALAGSIDDMIENHRALSKERNEMYEPSPKYREVVKGYYCWWHGESYMSPSLGFCATTYPMKRRYMSARLYNMLEDGSSPEYLSAYLYYTHTLAKAWRKHKLEDRFNEKVAGNRSLLARELGYKGHCHE